MRPLPRRKQCETVEIFVFFDSISIFGLISGGGGAFITKAQLLGLKNFPLLLLLLFFRAFLYKSKNACRTAISDAGSVIVVFVFCAVSNITPPQYFLFFAVIIACGSRRRCFILSGCLTGYHSFFIRLTWKRNEFFPDFGGAEKRWWIYAVIVI